MEVTCLGVQDRSWSVEHGGCPCPPGDRVPGLACGSQWPAAQGVSGGSLGTLAGHGTRETREVTRDTGGPVTRAWSEAQGIERF